MKEPLIKFKEWWDKALKDSPLSHKNAVCLSAINKLGFPSARFVDLKSANEKGFVFCTGLDSAKGLEISSNPKVSLTIWWDHVGLQIRVTGNAKQLSSSVAEKIWSERSREAQLATLCSKQSQILEDENQLLRALQQVESECEDQLIPKPDNWGGYIVEPSKIEFLRFKESRLHVRELYQKISNGWKKHYLQP